MTAPTPAPLTYTEPTFTSSTNVGPLTTSTSFPRDCYTNHYDFRTSGLGFPWGYTTGGCAMSTCCPSGSIYSQPFAWMTSYYSPGLFCPANYQTCTPPPPPYALQSEVGETIKFCCPESYGCPEFTTSSGLMIYDGCNSGFSTGIEIITVMDDINAQQPISTYTYTGTGYTWWQIAWPIQIRWKEQDLTLTLATSSPATSSTHLSTLTTTSLSSASTSLFTSTPTPPPTEPSSTNVLNVGSEVGSIVGAIVGFAAVVATIYYGQKQIRSQRRRKRELE